MTTNKELVEIKIKKIKPEDLFKRIQEEKLYILDVRPKGYDCAKCHSNRSTPGFLGNTVSISMNSLPERLKFIPSDIPIVITDVSMRQSSVAARFLLKNGFKVEGVLKGGLANWEESGLPTVLEAAVKGPGTIPPFE